MGQSILANIECHLEKAIYKTRHNAHKDTVSSPTGPCYFSFGV